MIIKKAQSIFFLFLLLVLALVFAIDVALILLGIYSFARTIEKFEELNDDIRAYKLSNKEIKDKLNKIKEDAIPIQKEYNEVVRNFGSWGYELIIPEIDPS